MAENSDATPGRKDYARKWVTHPRDPAVYNSPNDPNVPTNKKGLLEASPTQIEEAHAEMDADLRIRYWLNEVKKYSRTVIGKFHNAPDGGFTEVGIGTGQDLGIFTNRQTTLLDGSSLSRLDRILRGAEEGIDSSSHAGDNFIVAGPTVVHNGVETVQLIFLQFQQAAYTASSRGHDISLSTTFHLPRAVAGEFMGEVRQHPDLIASVFEHAVAPGLPEQVYRTRAKHLSIVSEEALQQSESHTGPFQAQQRFKTLRNSVKWLQYTQPHGGETPKK